MGQTGEQASAERTGLEESLSPELRADLAELQAMNAMSAEILTLQKHAQRLYEHLLHIGRLMEQQNELMAMIGNRLDALEERVSEGGT